MSYWGYAPYVSVAARRAKAEEAAAKATKGGAKFSPIAAYRGAIAKTFWGKAWCDNLECYSDYANRLPRGRTYTRNGSVIDLQIVGGDVHAKVMGSSLYSVSVTVAAVAAPHWEAIGTDCAGSIDSMVELLQGKLTKPVMERICQPKTGLFPTPKDIRFTCSCPDSASMCKHIAAVLYGVGARLDAQPEMLFNLRQVDAKDLVAQAGTSLPTGKSGKTGAASKKVLDAADLADVFGLEMDEAPPPAPASAATTRRATARQATTPAPAPKKPRAKASPTKVGRSKTSFSKTSLSKASPTKASPAKASPAKAALSKESANEVAKAAKIAKAAKAAKAVKSVKAAKAAKVEPAKRQATQAKPVRATKTVKAIAIAIATATATTPAKAKAKAKATAKATAKRNTLNTPKVSKVSKVPAVAKPAAKKPAKAKVARPK